MTKRRVQVSVDCKPGSHRHRQTLRSHDAEVASVGTVSARHQSCLALHPAVDITIAT